MYTSCCRPRSDYIGCVSPSMNEMSADRRYSIQFRVLRSGCGLPRSDCVGLRVGVEEFWTMNSSLCAENVLWETIMI